jgi:hypothetical protein
LETDDLEKEDRNQFKQIEKRVKSTFTFQHASVKKDKCSNAAFYAMIFGKILAQDEIGFTNAAKAQCLTNGEDELSWPTDENETTQLTFKSDFKLNYEDLEDENWIKYLRSKLNTKFGKASKGKAVTMIIYLTGKDHYFEPIIKGPITLPDFAHDVTQVPLKIVQDFKVESPNGALDENQQRKKFKLNISPDTKWSIINNSAEATWTPSYSGTFNFKVSVVDKKTTCESRPTDLTITIAKKPEEPIEEDRRKKRDGPEQTCNCVDGPPMESIFGEIPWEKYKYYQQDISGYQFYSNQAGGFVFNLITTRNCATNFKLKIINAAGDIILKKNYSLEDVTSSHILERPEMKECFVFSFSLSGPEYKKEWFGANYHYIEIDSYSGEDGNRDECETYKSPILIFTKCAE